MNKYYVMPAEIIESNFPEDNLSEFPVIFMKKENEDAKICEKMGHYLSNDGAEMPKILARLRRAKDLNKSLDDIKDIMVWEPLEHRFTIGEFCEMIGI